MAYFERWRIQQDADRMFEHLGFKERVINGVRLYYNLDTGETLNLDRPKYLYKKAIQKGCNISEGILDRLVSTIKEMDLTETQKATLREFYMQEQGKLDNTKQDLGLRDNL